MNVGGSVTVQAEGTVCVSLFYVNDDHPVLEIVPNTKALSLSQALSGGSLSLGSARPPGPFFFPPRRPPLQQVTTAFFKSGCNLHRPRTVASPASVKTWRDQLELDALLIRDGGEKAVL